MKHTPKPWEIDKRFAAPNLKSRVPSDLRIVSWKYDASGFGCTICRINGTWNLRYGEDSGQNISPRQEADAHLIIAAPDLLEACIDARYELAVLVNQFGLGFDTPTEYPVIVRLDTAIAKATEKELV